MKNFIFIAKRQRDNATRRVVVKADNCGLAMVVALKEVFDHDICELKLAMEHTDDFKEWSVRR